MKKIKILAAIMITTVVVGLCGCTEQKPETKIVESIAVSTPTPTPTPTLESLTKKIKVVMPTETPTQTPAPIKQTGEINIIEEPIEEPIIEEPVEEPEIIDSCFDENVQTGDYYEDIPPENTGDSSWTYYGDCTVTFYCNCEACCGVYAGGNTASGAYPTANWTVANGSLPFGTIVYIDGLGTYCVEDRGVGGDWFDIYVNDHSEIPGWGMGTFPVYIVN